MAKILITGGAGFIGSTLADTLLSMDKEVVVVDNFSDYYDPKIKEENVKANLNNPNYQLYRVNIEDLMALEEVFQENKIETIVHLAGRAGVRPSIENPLGYVKSNVEATTNILELMQKYQVPKLIFGSSSSIYGNCTADKFSEDLVVTKPISPYAATKSACEQICYTYHHLYGLKVLCMRFFTVYGPRQRPDLAIRKFIEKISKGEPIQMYGDGSSMRDYTYVEDIVSGLLGAINYNDSDYEIINIGGGNPITLKEMIATIETVLGKKAIIEQLPMQAGDVDKTVCDFTKANKLLDYQPKIKFIDGIKNFVEWKKAQG